MKNITQSIYTFENIREGNFLYVDKTEYIWKMVQCDGGMYFLSRPRRFGKSLTVSTLKALFQGKRELFKGLAIDNKPYDWKSYPVIHLDLGNCCSHSADELREFLKEELLSLVRQFSLTTAVDTRQLSSSFYAIIEELYEKRGAVVILIDEYDKPLQENLTNGKATEICDVLAEFYSTVKREEARERFVFLTGVTKFCQVSIFSKLNNLRDITMDGEYATMLGYTQEELEANFSEWLADAESRQALSHGCFMAKIKQWYDGFCFEADAASVYNPVSIACFFLNHGKFGNYWFATGTPTFLLELIKKTRFDFEEALTQPVDEIAFSAYEVENMNPLTLLLQTGYLTIRGTEVCFENTLYHLDFPNREVGAAFKTYLLDAYSEIGLTGVQPFTRKLSLALVNGKTDEFMDVLQTFLANIPYDIQLKDEKYYQSLIYVLFLAMGTQVQAEARTNRGRIDAVVLFDSHAYIIEFKIDKPVQSAMEQISNMEYYQRYRNSGRQLHLLGISLNSEERQVAEWQEKLE